jgi:hypothetical protein
MNQTEAGLREVLQVLAGDGSGPPIDVAELVRARRRRRAVATSTVSAVLLVLAVGTAGAVYHAHTGPGATTTPVNSAAPTVPSAQHPVTVSWLTDYRQYGIQVQLLYRASGREHLLNATLNAAGIVGRTEMYKIGSDTSGLPQQPTLEPGQTTSVAAFAFPACATANLGAHPVLTVIYASPTGASTTRAFPLDTLTSRLEALARGWCQHGVMIGVDTAQGNPGCDVQKAILVVRNPSLVTATLTVDGPIYHAQPLTLPPGGSAHWTVRSPGACPYHPSTATVRYNDGRVTHVSLGFDSPL